MTGLDNDYHDVASACKHSEKMSIPFFLRNNIMMCMLSPALASSIRYHNDVCMTMAAKFSHICQFLEEDVLYQKFENQTKAKKGNKNENVLKRKEQMHERMNIKRGRNQTGLILQKHG